LDLIEQTKAIVEQIVASSASDPLLPEILARDGRTDAEGRRKDIAAMLAGM
jgi:hypothetical protein